MLFAAATVGINMSIDIYGLYRDTKGRQLVDYGDNRIAKYLLSVRYVPKNFDAILIGPSISSNWDTHGIRTLRTYNESLNGSNFVEQEPLIYNALASPGLKAAFIIVHPSMTAAHDFSTVELTERERWAALGSLSLLDAYKDWFTRRRHLGRPISDDYGTDFFDDPAHLNAIAANLMRPGSDFYMDPAAVRSFRRILSECRRHHITVVYVIPPTSPPIFEPKRDAFRKYFAFVNSEKRPEEPVIDLDAPRYGGFKCNAGNFSDGVHISNAATPRLVAILDDELRHLRQGGLL